MKKVLVVYFTQSGQLKQIADNVCNHLDTEDVILDFYEIKPLKPFDFPWNNDSFFDTFPESVKGIPCEIERPSFNHDEYDLIILAYQVWFLSPSIPFWSFLNSIEAKKLIKDKPVITILGIRNMWIAAHEKVKKKIAELEGDHVGNIVLYDKHQNLVSVITIVHWMYTARKEKFGIFPPAGISDTDILQAERFGKPIAKAIKQNDFIRLQDELLALKAVRIIPDLMSMEEKAIRIFGIWSKFVLKKGGSGDTSRKRRLVLFRYYLFVIIYLVSPIASLLFYITYPLLFWRIISRMKYNNICTTCKTNSRALRNTLHTSCYLVLLL